MACVRWRLHAPMLMVLFVSSGWSDGYSAWMAETPPAKAATGLVNPIVPRGPTNNSDMKASGPAYNHTYTKHVNKTVGALACQATCDADAHCQAWTYVPYGDSSSGPRSCERCCLFSRLGCPVTRQGVISGAKTAEPCSNPPPPPSPAPIPPPGPPPPRSKRMLASDTDAMLFFDSKFICNSTGLKAHVGESHLVAAYVDPTVRPPSAM